MAESPSHVDGLSRTLFLLFSTFVILFSRCHTPAIIVHVINSEIERDHGDKKNLSETCQLEDVSRAFIFFLPPFIWSLGCIPSNVLVS